MNKLTKIGASALCGSLAAVSAAQAGEMTVAGGATVTYMSLDYGVTGNPLGMSTAITFTGSGELDNGGVVAVNMALDDKATYSASDISVDLPGIGKFSFDQGGGTGLDRFDDMMPTAWEEVSGTGVGTGIQTVAGVGGQTDIEWAVSSDLIGEGNNIYLSYTPKADGSKNNDKSVSGAASSIANAGYDIGISSTSLAEGLNIFAGLSSIDREQDDQNENVMGFTYAIGSFTLGYQHSKADLQGTADAYDNDAFGVSFAVNDNLSISYGEHDSSQNQGGNNSPKLSSKSVQAAYSMGGATIKIANTTVDGANYDSTTASDRSGTAIALSLAF